MSQLTTMETADPMVLAGLAECLHTRCSAEDVMIYGDCERGLRYCCGCCGPERDSRWEAHQDR